MSTYNEGVQCCRFCKALMTTERACEHTCINSLVEELKTIDYITEKWRALLDDHARNP